MNRKIYETTKDYQKAVEFIRDFVKEELNGEVEKLKTYDLADLNPDEDPDMMLITQANLIHLMRGQVYEIDGIRFFCFGGAHSTDWMYRQEGISWFPEEIPSRKEYEEGWKNLAVADFQVDYIVTHTAPREVAAAMGYGELSDEEVTLRKYLQQVADNTEFAAWYFGHFHEDTEIEDTFYCLYNTLQMIE